MKEKVDHATNLVIEVRLRVEIVETAIIITKRNRRMTKTEIKVNLNLNPRIKIKARARASQKGNSLKTGHKSSNSSNLSIKAVTINRISQEVIPISMEWNLHKNTKNNSCNNNYHHLRKINLYKKMVSQAVVEAGAD